MAIWPLQMAVQTDPSSFSKPLCLLPAQPVVVFSKHTHSVKTILEVSIILLFPTPQITFLLKEKSHLPPKSTKDLNLWVIRTYAEQVREMETSCFRTTLNGNPSDLLESKAWSKTRTILFLDPMLYPVALPSKIKPSDTSCRGMSKSFANSTKRINKG